MLLSGDNGIEDRSLTRAIDLSFSAATTYLPIAEHGVIGDLHTVALVGTDGTIDWYCCPRFDSPSVFAAILDADRGGRYRIAPALAPATSKQLYFPDTNVLITRFLTPDGVGEVQDFMPIDDAGRAHRHRLIRRVLCVRGDDDASASRSSRASTTAARSTRRRARRRGRVFASPALTLRSRRPSPLEAERRRACRRAVHARAPARARRSCSSACPRPTSPRPSPPRRDARRTSRTRSTSGAAGSRARSYRGRWREMVHRSALTLKLLTYEPTRRDRRGARRRACPRRSAARATGTTATRGSATPRSRCTRCCGSASPTRPAPSWTGSTRPLPRAGRPTSRGPLQIMYGIDGRRELTEEIARPLRGLPRLGAGADRQRRRRPAAARHLRRADRLRLPLQQVRRRRSPTTLGAT